MAHLQVKFGAKAKPPYEGPIAVRRFFAVFYLLLIIPQFLLAMLFSERYRFSDWPNQAIPALAAGVYAIWDNEILIYCGMSGREFEKAQAGQKKKYGLITRLASHASGRLSGDQFCVYVANRLVIPGIQSDQLSGFASGEHTLDRLTKAYIHSRFDYQFAIVDSSRQAYELEMKARDGSVFGMKPLLNPA